MIHCYDVVSVEDDQLLFSLMADALAGPPIALRHARTGAQGLELLTQANPNLLLLDISLPDMRGWELLDRAAAQGILTCGRVIVLTSHAEIQHRIIGKLNDVIAYMNKPFTPFELQDKVRGELGLARPAQA